VEQRLGRGLDSLISSTVEVESHNVTEVALDKIRVNPKQPRQTWDEGSLEELANSIKLHGVIQPVLVRRSGNHFELIAGERRFRASRIAGLKKIPVHQTDAKGVQSLELALIENIQRENLNAIDEAAAYHQLLLQSKMTHQELAQRVGKKRATVSNSLRLLDLPEELQSLLTEGRLSAGQARALLGVKDKDRMIDLGLQASKEGWSVRELERRVRQSDGKVKAKGADTEALKSPVPVRYEEDLRNIYGTKVKINDVGGRGEVRLVFYSAADRDRLLHQLLTGEAGSPVSGS
jgi:ParB family chromosome partitioning protein